MNNFKPNLLILFFVIALLIALAPQFFYKYFPTVDGPAHLYNSKIICGMLLDTNDLYHHYFNFNSQLVPNWTVHMVGAVFGLILPVWLVEKLIVILIVIGIPVGMLMLAKALGGKPGLQYFVVLPFTCTLPLYLGFYNFMLSIPFLFLIMAQMIKWETTGHYKLWKMVVGMTLLYLTHVFSFVLAMLFYGILLISKFRKQPQQLISKQVFNRLLVFLPGLLFAVIFFSTRSLSGFKNHIERLSLEQLLQWIKEGGPLIGLNGEMESPFTTVFVFMLLALSLAVLFVRWRVRQKSLPADILLIMVVLMLILYFVVPDGIASGGFVSIRLLLFALLFLTIWIVSLPLKTPFSFIAGLTGAYVCFSTLGYRLQTAEELNRDAKDVVAVTADIAPNSTLLPLNYSTNWLHTNISNYLGAAGNILVLDNYEAKLDEFPIKWNPEKAPGMLAGNFGQSLNPDISIENYEKTTGEKINYLTRWCYDPQTADSTAKATNEQIGKYFFLKSKQGKMELFQRK